MLGLAVAPALVFGTGMFFLPETPRWLIRGGHHEVAHRVLMRIRDIADVNVEIEEIKASLAQHPLLLVGIAGMIIALCVLGLSFRYPSGQLAWIAVICLMSYVASFAISLGPIFWLLIAEIYPLKIRGIAEGTAATLNWASNLIVSLTFLTLVERLVPVQLFCCTRQLRSRRGSSLTISFQKRRGVLWNKSKLSEGIAGAEQLLDFPRPTSVFPDGNPYL